MDRARLIIDPPADGAWNMAVDQALLETADQSGQITLRFYQWAEPTLSLGYFQSHKDRTLHPPSLNCPLVRRRTGGGAILHDRELTYSLCVPSTHRWSTKNSQLYETFHELVIEILNEFGCHAALYRNSMQGVDELEAEICERLESDSAASIGFETTNPRVDQKAFMCFRRRSPGDVVASGYKIVGSAQRRAKNALLQHGSILLESSEFAPELHGMRELCGKSVTVSETIEKLVAMTENRLLTDLIAGKLSQIEIEAAEGAQTALFGDYHWNLRR